MERMLRSRRIRPTTPDPRHRTVLCGRQRGQSTHTPTARARARAGSKRGKRQNTSTAKQPTKSAVQAGLENREYQNRSPTETTRSSHNGLDPDTSPGGTRSIRVRRTDGPDRATQPPKTDLSVLDASTPIVTPGPSPITFSRLSSPIHPPSCLSVPAHPFTGATPNRRRSPHPFIRIPTRPIAKPHRPPRPLRTPTRSPPAGPASPLRSMFAQVNPNMTPQWQPLQNHAYSWRHTTTRGGAAR